MLNTDKIKKIKGILSAKEGTQVPKFLNPALEINTRYLRYLERAGEFAIPESKFNLLPSSELDKLILNGNYFSYDKSTNYTGLETRKQLEAKLAEGTADPLITLTELNTNNLSILTNTAEDAAREAAYKVATAFTENSGNENKGNVSTRTAGEEVAGTTEANALGNTAAVDVAKMLRDLEKASEKNAELAAQNADITKQNEDLAKKVTTKEKTKNTKLVNSVMDASTDFLASAFVDKSEFADDDPTQGKWRSAWDSTADVLKTVAPAAGWAMDLVGIANDVAGTRAQNFAVDETTLSKVGGSYGGTTGQIYDAANKAGKKYGLLAWNARNKANSEIDEARRKQFMLEDIAKDSYDAKHSSTYLTDVLAQKRQYDMGDLFNPKYLRVAKEGGTIESEEDFEIEITSPEDTNFLKEGGSLVYEDFWSPIISDDVEILKSGGNVKTKEEPNIDVIETNTVLKSVIPEGALHKNKHHLEETGLDDSELTKKGIPVVDNKGEQLAEIELNEIIFTLEVTKELEKRYKEFYQEDTSESRKNELALEAGKLLWKEIIYNTDDRTGLIDTLKQGGVLSAKKGTKTENPEKQEKNKKVQKKSTEKLPFEEWVKDVNPEYLSDNYDLETAYYYLPIDRLNAWKHAVSNTNSKFVRDLYMTTTNWTPEGFDFPYHLGSIAPCGDGNFIFLKKGREEDNPEVHFETDTYYSGENGLNKTHDLIYDDENGRYFYIRKEITKHAAGGELPKLETSSDVNYIEYSPVIDLISSKDTVDVEEKLNPWLNNDYLDNLTSSLDSLSDVSETFAPIWNPETPESLVSSSTVLPTPKNLNLDGWNINGTLLYLREHAHDKSTHYCARAVRLALEAGGLVGFRVPNAKDEINLNTLETIGFQPVAKALDNKVTTGYVPLAGDIAISYENGNHAAMYDGTRWISDFRQNTLDVYNSVKNTKSVIYRRVQTPEQQLLAMNKQGGVFQNIKNIVKSHLNS